MARLLVGGVDEVHMAPRSPLGLRSDIAARRLVQEFTGDDCSCRFRSYVFEVETLNDKLITNSYYKQLATCQQITMFEV